jgi:hypothetical protein
MEMQQHVPCFVAGVDAAFNGIKVFCDALQMLSRVPSVLPLSHKIFRIAVKNIINVCVYSGLSVP